MCYSAKRKHYVHGPIATIASDNQVKTYMDNSNGLQQQQRTSSAYNKLSPGRGGGGDSGAGSDTDMEPQASQSQDCEPTPPLQQRHGSKSNLFLGAAESAADSPALRGGMRVASYGGGPQGGRRCGPPPPVALSPAETRPSPTQRVRALGVPTPLAMSSPVRR